MQGNRVNTAKSNSYRRMTQMGADEESTMDLRWWRPMERQALTRSRGAPGWRRSSV